jgi:hypothetical protein
LNSIFAPCASLLTIDQSNESEPRGPGFDFTPEGWSLPSSVDWNDGMMGCWSSGILG